MITIYRLLSFIIYPFLFFYLKFRVFRGKESSTRFKEKLGKINLEKKENLVWFHVASLGEIRSIVELVKYYQSHEKINILITSVTTSSYEFFKKYLYSTNTFHQYAPLDNPIIIKKFLKYWRPYVSVFVESELWPNMILQTSQYSKLILLNCRISKRSFLRWKKIKKTFTKILKKFDGISFQNNETKKYLEFFGIKKINNLGNLKYTFNIKKNLKLFDIEENKFNWVSMSIHFNEIDAILNVHKKISCLESDVTTFLIPRHLNKLKEIKKKIQDQNIPLIETSKNNKIIKFNGIVLVDQFGVAEEIFDKVKIVFMGGSFIDHGGQNPIEPMKYGSRIFYGPNIHNFTEIYEELDKKNISKMVKNEHELYNELEKYIKNDCPITIEKSFDKFGKEILTSNIKFLNQFINLQK